MFGIPFATNFACTLDADRVSLYEMSRLCRLTLSPLPQIASTINEKLCESVFQSVVLSSLFVSPQPWKLRKLVLYLSSAPKSISEEQWMQQQLNLISSALCAALTIVCKSSALKSMYLKKIILTALAVVSENALM